MVVNRALVLICAMAIGLSAQEPYKGPVPEKTDLPYIRHANKLVPTDAGDAAESAKKDDTIYTVSGVGSTARTPLSEPTFIIKVAKMNVQQMMLYKMESKGGQRQLVIPKNNRRGQKPLRLSLDPLSSGLYKLEVQEALENGEYCLSPGGSNSVYCFTVY